MLLTRLHKKFPHHIPIMTDYCYEQMKGDIKMFITKREYERLCEDIAELRAKLEEEREKTRDAWEHFYALDRRQTNSFLRDYEIAVLWHKDKHCLDVWNNGRFEKGVRAVIFGQEGPGTVPSLTLQK